VSSADPLRWILEKPLESAPGARWNYNTGASHVLSAILAEASGQTTRAFAQAQLFDPLGEQIGAWPADPRGYHFGGHGSISDSIPTTEIRRPPARSPA
jgi:CubicO group peptidase (beta-lactamase class C family)